MRIDEFAIEADGHFDPWDRRRIVMVGFDLLLPLPAPIVPLLNPQICLQYSNDGGFTWSNERWKEVGKIGEHRKMIYWDRLGMARDRVFRIVVSEPCKWILTDAMIDSDEGNS